MYKKPPCSTQSFSMFRLFGVIVLVVTMKSATAYDYFDSTTKAAAEKIEGTYVTLNQLLSLDKYIPSSELTKAFQRYKSTAAKVKGKSCAVPENKFDSSYQELLKGCVAKAASKEDKQKLTKAISEGLSEIQVIDKSLKMNAQLFPSSDSATSPGQVAKSKSLESVKKVLEKHSTSTQAVFHATKSGMDACVAAESKKLWGNVIDAIKAVDIC